jgi:hypothetical protein
MKNNIENKFYLLISILTFIFMVLGATFAYYTSNVKSNELVEVESTNLNTNLNITPLYNKESIIPTNDNDILKAFNNECIDDYGYGACYAYNIQIENLGVEQDLIGMFSLKSETIKNLKYLILDADNNNEIYKDITASSDTEEKIGDYFHLDTGESKNLILIIWLSNLEENQDYDTSGVFTGEFSVNSTIGSKLTGTINTQN